MYSKYNEEVIAHIYPILKNFLYHIEMYRHINARIDELPGDIEFWVYTNDAHIMNATMYWCKVFGSYEEKNHWHKIFLEEEEKSSMISQYFSMLEKNDVSKNDYVSLHKEIKRFRDKYVAHSDGYMSPIPNFDYAYTAVFCLDRLIRENTPYLFEDKPLAELVKVYRDDIFKTIDSVIELKNFKEK